MPLKHFTAWFHPSPPPRTPKVSTQNDRSLESRENLLRLLESFHPDNSQLENCINSYKKFTLCCIVELSTRAWKCEHPGTANQSPSEFCSCPYNNIILDIPGKPLGLLACSFKISFPRSKSSPDAFAYILLHHTAKIQLGLRTRLTETAPYSSQPHRMSVPDKTSSLLCRGWKQIHLVFLRPNTKNRFLSKSSLRTFWPRQISIKVRQT